MNGSFRINPLTKESEYRMSKAHVARHFPIYATDADGTQYWIETTNGIIRFSHPPGTLWPALGRLVSETTMKPKDMNDDGEAGYRAGYRPAVLVDLRQVYTPQSRETTPGNGGDWASTGAITDESRAECVRQFAKHAHKSALSQAETEQYTKPAKEPIMSWPLFWFLTAMALLGIAIAYGVAMVNA